MRLLYGLALTLFLSFVRGGEDYYAVLGVAKNADDRTIRKAFKKLALSKHPDKHQGDEEAHAEFVKINKAYEILKDEELRKKYDQFGEEGLSENFQGGQRYESWQFYKDNFGIYDEDVEITTISRADFQKLVSDSGETWFINFYSTFCSHCHQLAPAWRKFAQQMEGVIRIGAVNCAEDPMLCQSQRVNGYPSLVIYPQGVFYNGVRDVDLLVEFAMNYVRAEILFLNSQNFQALTEEWNQYAAKPWVIDLCDDEEDCLSTTNRRKLAAMLDGAVNVGRISCAEASDSMAALCEDVEDIRGVAFFPAGSVDKEHRVEISSLDPKEIASAALYYMSGLQKITKDELMNFIDKEANLKGHIAAIFVRDKAHLDSLLTLKRLPSLLTDVRIGYADCSQLEDFCAKKMDVSKLPLVILFKPNGYEINTDTASTHREVLSFVKESRKTPLISLTESAYNDAVSSGKLWLIDYFAPWCAPCMRHLGELRSIHSALAAQQDELQNELHIGTIDCSRYRAICQQAGVANYPSSILYHEEKSFRSVGYHSMNQVIDFIQNSLNPSVIELTPDEFRERVLKRKKKETWIVDFFAPWCGPCQQLAPEYQKVARGFDNEGEEGLFFGSVDCAAHNAFCVEQRVTGYPTIRAFPTKRAQTRDYPPNMWRNSDSISRWVYTILPSLVHEVGNDFWQRVLDSPDPWLVDFYAPWCGHCVQFAPYFEQIAKILDGRVNLAKIDCDQWPGVCQGALVAAYPTIRFYGGSRGGRQEVTGLHLQSYHRDQIIGIVENELARRAQLRDEL